MKPLLSVVVLLVFATVLGSQVAHAAPKKKTQRSAQTKPSDTKIATRLPEYKGKKKMKVDFEQNDGTHTTTVVVRTPLPLEKALEEQSAAEAKVAQKVAPALVPLVSAPRPAQAAVIVPFTDAKTIRDVAPIPSPVDGELVFTSSGTSKNEEKPLAEISLSPPPIQDLPIKNVENGALDVSTTSKSDAPLRYSRASRDQVQSDVIRFHARASYLKARYSYYESGLQDDATSLGIGLSRQREHIEGRITAEIGHGLDQSVTPQNTRHLLFRFDANYLFLNGRFTPFAGLGLGYGTANLRSFRAVDGNNLTIKEHMKTTGLITTPAVGLRLKLGAEAVLDLSAEYLAFLGENSANLGGWAGAVSIGLPF